VPVCVGGNDRVLVCVACVVRVRGNDRVPVCVGGNDRVAWPRRERDVAATSRGRRALQSRGGVVVRHGEAGVRLGVMVARRGWGHGSASRRGCARTRAGPSFPGPQRGRAVRGAPASRARGTTWRRRERRRRQEERAARRAPATRAARWPDGRGSPKPELRRAHRRPVAHAGSRGDRGGVAATLTDRGWRRPCSGRR
jgi:hypothetical protein